MASDFLRDFYAEDFVVLNPTRTIQMSVDIATHLLAETNQAVPTKMTEAFSYLERPQIISPGTADNMWRSVGFRNIAVHCYNDIDLAITYAFARQHLANFADYLHKVCCFVQLEA